MVRAEIVANPEKYIYSFAWDYQGEKGVVTIESYIGADNLRKEQFTKFVAVWLQSVGLL